MSTSPGETRLDLSPSLSQASAVGIGFVRVLRAAGLDVPLGALLEFVRALGLLGLSSASGVYWSGRATLVTRPEDLEVYDRCFWAFLSPNLPTVAAPPLDELRQLSTVADSSETPPSEEEATTQPSVARYSAREVLRQRDFATLSAEERAEAAALLGEIRFADNDRVSRRLSPSRHRSHRPDLRRAVRRAVRLDGEVRVDRFLERSVVARRLVLLLDVSGSMEPYSRELLRFAQVALRSRRPVEVFVFGTRLTRLTRHLAGADLDQALQRSVAAIPDLSGGTRLGESLASFNSIFGVRGLARGSIVVICSDGIDRGETALLEAELERLGRVAHRIIWVNPLKASPGYAPLARGMAAALPHVDLFVEGHSVSALAALAAALGE